MLRKPLQLIYAFHDVRIVCRIGGPSPGWGGVLGKPKWCVLKGLVCGVKKWETLQICVPKENFLYCSVYREQS